MIKNFFISKKILILSTKFLITFFNHSLEIYHFRPCQIQIYTKRFAKQCRNDLFMVVYTNISKHFGMREICIGLSMRFIARVSRGISLESPEFLKVNDGEGKDSLSIWIYMYYASFVDNLRR